MKTGTEKSKELKYFACLVIIPAAFLLVSACGSGSRQEESQVRSDENDQVRLEDPEKLEEMESRIEDLFAALDGPTIKAVDKGGKEGQDAGGQEKGKEESKEQEEQKAGGGQDGRSEQEQGAKQEGANEQGTQQEGTGGQNTKQIEGQKQESAQGQQNKQNQQPDKWPEIEKIINELHYQWNGIVPEITRNGADIRLIDNFGNALNQLTTGAASKDGNKVLVLANAVYSHMPGLFSIYGSKTSPEVKRLVYYARNIIIESQNNNWEKVVKDSDSMEKSWSLFRNTLEKEHQQSSDKLNFSIYELKKVATGKDKQLTGIKGRIVLNNLKELQQSIDKG